MIKSFNDKRTYLIFKDERIKRLDKDIQKKAFEKLAILDSAEDLKDLLVPPSNFLEKLLGDRKESYSIRVNKQFRICFRWEEGHAYDVEFVDYH